MVAAATTSATQRESITVGQLLDRWLEHSETIGRSPTTIREYRRIADKTIRPALGSKRLAKLDAMDLDRLYATLNAKGNKPTTIRRVHALMSAALAQAEKWDLVERNVARRASPPPVGSPDVSAPSVQDVQTLLRAAQPRRSHTWHPDLSRSDHRCEKRRALRAALVRPRLGAMPTPHRSIGLRDQGWRMGREGHQEPREAIRGDRSRFLGRSPSPPQRCRATRCEPRTTARRRRLYVQLVASGPRADPARPPHQVLLAHLRAGGHQGPPPLAPALLSDPGVRFGRGSRHCRQATRPPGPQRHRSDLRRRSGAARPRARSVSRQDVGATELSAHPRHSRSDGF